MTANAMTLSLPGDNHLNFYQTFQKETAPFRQALLQEATFHSLINGTISKEAYALFLRETYHFASHTSRFLAAAASRIPEDKMKIRTRFLHHALEEDGHHLFALKDLRNLGFGDGFAKESLPLAGTTAIVSHHYYIAHMGNPVGMMGAVLVFEGLALDFASKSSEEIRERHGLPSYAVTFLHTHGHFDIDHMADAIKVLNTEITDPQDQRDIIEVAKKMYDFYRWNFLEIGLLTGVERDREVLHTNSCKNPEASS